MGIKKILFLVCSVGLAAALIAGCGGKGDGGSKAGGGNGDSVSDSAGGRGGTLADARDGKTYKTVKIGMQTWMAENLNYKASGSRCYGEGGEVHTYGFEDQNDYSALADSVIQGNCTKYGRLYSWAAATGVCPKGWHLPGNAEWDQLFRYADGTSGTDSPYESETAGRHLKSASGWIADELDEEGSGVVSVDINGTDTLGFAALPGGSFAPSDGYFYGGVGSPRSIGHWWSSSRNGGDAYNTVIAYDWANYGSGSGLYSVRCLQDNSGYVDKCNGKSYNPETQFCAGGDILGKCGDGWYIPETQFCDSRDNQVYKHTTIGKHTWMAENLKYKIENSWCYDDDESNCKEYGRLYDLNTARAVCPSGWHLSGRNEWENLMAAVGGVKRADSSDGNSYEAAGKKLKSKTGWNDYDGKSGNGTDDFGFAALPGGYRSDNGGSPSSFSSIGNSARWWLATEEGASGRAYDRSMFHSSGNVGEYRYNSKEDGFSVRCAKDQR
jgi:uncharacterized protein (TIGR02145 family)